MLKTFEAEREIKARKPRERMWRRKLPGKRRKIKTLSEDREKFNMRVRSWLRMNAGGVPNTCKSNGHKKKLRWKLMLVADG